MKLIKQLIQIPSYSGQEKKIQKFIFQWCQKQGLPIFWQGENLAIHFKGKNSQKAIIFNSHVDTVGTGDLKKWHYPPFKGVIENGKIYGLGASDEKASVATLILLGESFKNKTLFADLWLTFMVKEEVNGSGTKSFLAWFKKQSFLENYQEITGVICEPTQLKKIEIGHLGNVFLRVTTFGDSGHGSRPKKIKKHAVFQMYEVIKRVKLLEKKWQSQFFHPILGVPTIGVATAIKAGTLKTPNKFPDSCQATFDVRTTPQIHSLVKNLFESELTNLGAKVNFVYVPCSFGLTDKREKIVKIAQEVLLKAKIGKSKGASDLCFFTEAGIPAIILGPGSNRAVHKENEFCQISEIPKAVDVYQKIIEKFFSEL